MPVPNPGSKVGSDTQKVKFLTISGRPKNAIFGYISGVPKMRMRGALRIGVHSDASVTSCDWGRQRAKDPDQMVTQVFGSAVSILLGIWGWGVL